MAKVLSDLTLMKKDYSQMIKLNQRLRYIASGYYIDWDGTIFMQSSVPFVEKVVTLHDPESIGMFRGTMIMPNALFEFSKNAKKTKLTIKKEDTMIYLGQEDQQELNHAIHIVCPSFDALYAKNNVVDKMYKRFFSTSSEFVQYPDSDKLDILPDEMVKKMCKAQAVYYEYNGTILTLTKHVMLDIKKEDHLSLQRWGYELIENDQYRVSYILTQETELYTVKTLFNKVQKRRVM